MTEEKTLVETLGLDVEIKISSDGDGFHGWVPTLSGCHVGGETEAECRANLRDALQLYFESFVSHDDKHFICLHARGVDVKPTRAQFFVYALKGGKPQLVGESGSRGGAYRIMAKHLGAVFTWRDLGKQQIREWADRFADMVKRDLDSGIGDQPKLGE